MINHKQRREQRRLEEERAEQKRKISRRGFLVATGLAAIVGGIYGIRELFRAPTYEEALKDPQKRQAYAESLLEEKAEYVDMQYMPQGLLAKLEEEGYVIPFGAFAVTVPHERDPFRVGTKSTIILTNECFEMEYQLAKLGWHDIDLLARNTVQYHERIHADHFHNGIPQYETKKFIDRTGEIKSVFFRVVSELLAHREEYEGLQQMRGKATSGLIQRHIANLRKLVMPHYEQLHNPETIEGIDPAFINRLKQELHPRILLK